MKLMTRLAGAGVISVALSVGIAAQQPAQQPQSAERARELVGLLDAHRIQAVAATDPRQAGRFVAALYIPGAELLVVSASYPVPAVLENRLKQNDYREIYIDLQSTRSAKDRFFVEDMQGNGLHASCEAGEPFDSVSENGKEIRFNDDWAGQDLTEAVYRSRFKADDARYTEMLSVLIARLQSTT